MFLKKSTFPKKIKKSTFSTTKVTNIFKKIKLKKKLNKIL